MNWPEYVAFTATTALPAAANPEYIRLGVMEEAFECLIAYSSLQAAIFGRQKRVLRGDAESVLQAKEDAIAKARAQFVEELGDLAWYVARMGCKLSYLNEALESRLTDVSEALWNFVESQDALNAKMLFEDMLSMSGENLDVVLRANVEKLTARKSAGTLKGEGNR